MAQGGGGSTVTGESTLPSVWETFRIEKLTGSGEIAQGDQVTLKANNGRNYLMARDGGGGDVTADSTNRSVWETFSFQFYNPMLVRLRAADSHYLAAENGGGREITAMRNSPYTWETFTLVNRSRKSGLRDGDSVSFRVWNGKFLSAVRGGGSNLVADQNRAAGFETFTIVKPGGGEISLRDRVSFRTNNAANYIMAVNGGGGIVDASSRQAREWETFELEQAELAPVDFAHTPTTTEAGRPLAPPPRRMTGAIKVLALVIEFTDRRADPTLTMDHVRDFLFGSGRSVRRWVESNSYGALTIENAGVYGSIRMPRPYGGYGADDNAYGRDILAGAERLGLRFRELDRSGDRVITNDELFLVVLDFSGLAGGGQERGLTFTTRDGLTYSGGVFTAGLFTAGGPVAGRAQLDGIYSTVIHEAGHLFFNLSDRYGTREPLRGDVIATQTAPAEWERFTIRRVRGTGAIADDLPISLGAHDGSLVVVDDDANAFLNAGSSVVGVRETFRLKRSSGAGAVSDGDEVGFLAFNGRYVMANLGGGDVVRAAAGRLDRWETFRIHRMSGPGIVQSGDVVTLETDNHHYMLVGIGQRTSDPAAFARGYTFGGGCGLGVGGGFDIMDDNCRRVMLAGYDRIKQGWITARVVTPENKTSYVLRPSFSNAEALVLWDPFYPQEWYVVENRQQRPGFDEIPSNGLVVSWVNESSEYWSGVSADYPRYPAVISAAAPKATPNIFIAPPTLNSLEAFKREDPAAAFVTGEVTLRRGDGSLSRFSLSFHRRAGESTAVSVH
jgi:hypothetical protein